MYTRYNLISKYLHNQVDVPCKIILAGGVNQYLGATILTKVPRVDRFGTGKTALFSLLRWKTNS